MPLQLTPRLKSSFEHDAWQQREVSDADIHYSRLSGMAPDDIDVLCDFTRDEGLLMIIRCPKRPARYFHGKVPPKPLEVKQKSDPNTGLVTTADGQQYVSDYDLMSVWRFLGADDYEKIFFSAPDKNFPKSLSPEAEGILAKANARLQSSQFQHGAQDDFHSPKNPNVQMRSEGSKQPDRFMVFNIGVPQYMSSGSELKALYTRLLGQASWPYDDDGVHEAARKKP